MEQITLSLHGLLHKEYLKTAFVSLLILFATWHVGFDYMGVQFAFGMMVLCLPISYCLGKKYGLIFGSYSLFVSVYSIYTCAFVHGRYKDFQFDFQSQISVASTYTTLLVFMIVIGTTLIPRNFIPSIRRGIGVLGVINALVVIHSSLTNFRLPGGHGYTGLLDYSGMNGTLIALCSSFLIPLPTDSKAPRYLKLIGLLIAFIGIVLSKSAIPYGVFGLVVASRFINLKGLHLMAYSLFAGYFFVGEKMMNSSRRFEAYKVFMSFLVKSKNWLLGTGPGTLTVYAPTVQLDAKFMVEMTDKGIKGWLWNWLHSDFLQSFFEMGIVGFVLGILVFAQALLSTYRKKEVELFSLGLGLLGALSLNYPCRYFSTAFLLAFFVTESLRREEPNRVENLDLKASPQ